jgi:hypothetical protein
VSLPNPEKYRGYPLCTTDKETKAKRLKKKNKNKTEQLAYSHPSSDRQGWDLSHLSTLSFLLFSAAL